jgi:hypothetical protein
VEREPGTKAPRGWIRRALPWLVGVAILAVIVARLPFAAFRAELGRGPHLTLALVDFALATASIFTDSLASWIGLIAAKLARPFRDVAAVRGATALLVLVNYAVGQGGFGYYLHRTGATPLRAAGATLFLIGANLAILLVATPLAWWALDVEAPNAAIYWTIVIGCSGLGAYLVVIALRPRVFVERQLFAPLFDAGVLGHAIAIAARIPHTALTIVAQWLALYVWGIDVPWRVAIAVMPSVAIASSLPISPAGLGTSQAALVFFFAPFAAGATAGDREAVVLAFSIVHYVYSMLAAVLVGLACAPFAKRAAAAAA